MIEILSWCHKQGRAPRVPLGLQQGRLPGAGAAAHRSLGASLSAGHQGAFFLFAFLCCRSGAVPLAAPASSGCVPPAAEGKSRISGARCGKRPPRELGAQTGTEQPPARIQLTHRPARPCGHQVIPRLPAGLQDVHVLTPSARRVHLAPKHHGPGVREQTGDKHGL